MAVSTVSVITEGGSPSQQIFKFATSELLLFAAERLQMEQTRAGGGSVCETERPGVSPGQNTIVSSLSGGGHRRLGQEQDSWFCLEFPGSSISSSSDPPGSGYSSRTCCPGCSDGRRGDQDQRVRNADHLSAECGPNSERRVKLAPLRGAVNRPANQAFHSAPPRTMK